MVSRVYERLVAVCGKVGEQVGVRSGSWSGREGNWERWCGQKAMDERAGRRARTSCWPTEVRAALHSNTCVCAAGGVRVPPQRLCEGT